MPGENNTTSDKDRIINFLEQEYENVVMPYKIIKTLYPPMS